MTRLSVVLQNEFQFSIDSEGLPDFLTQKKNKKHYFVLKKR